MAFQTGNLLANWINAGWIFRGGRWREGPAKQNDQRPIQVVVFGKHTRDWMVALGPDAAVWKLVPNVESVLVVDGVLPQVAPELGINDFKTVILPLLEDHILNCPRDFYTLCPSDRAVQVFRDKGKFARYAKAIRLDTHCPTVFPSEEHVTFPCVVKRTNLNSGAGVKIASDKSELRAILSLRPWHNNPYIIQSFISGTRECVFHLVCRRGRIIWHRCYGYNVDDLTIRNTRRETVAMSATEQQLQLMEAFLKPLKFSGPCNVDCKFASDGRLIVLEINPRLGGSLMRPENGYDLRDALSCIISNAEYLQADNSIVRSARESLASVLGA